MKVGLSFSRCVLDIVEGRVSINDVLVVISRTDMDPHNEEHWDSVYRGYCQGSMWTDPIWNTSEHSESTFYKIVMDLYNSGKLHQPRQFGTMPTYTDYHWLETIVPYDNLKQHPAAHDAWERYLVTSRLAGLPEPEIHNP